MDVGVPGRVIAAIFALAAFAVAIVAGLAVGNPPGRILASALVSMVLCQVVGWAVGAIGERVVREHLASGGAPGAARGRAGRDNA